MSGYYYLDDPKSEFGSSPVSEEEFVRAIFSIASKHGLEITDEMILKEIEGNGKLTKRSKKPRVVNIRGRCWPSAYDLAE